MLKHFPRVFNNKIFYGWIVVGILYITRLTAGVRLSLGAYFIPWEADFSVGRTAVTLIATLGWVIFALFLPLAGSVIDKYGSRSVLSISIFVIGISLMCSSASTQFWHLAVLVGLFASIGLAGCSDVAVTSVAAHWFVERRGFVIGLISSGMAVGTLIIVPASLYLIDNYGWRITILLMGALITFVLTPLCYFFIRSKPGDLGLQAYGTNNNESVECPEVTGESAGAVTSAGTFKRVVFWQLAFTFFVCGFTDIGLIGTHFIPFAEGREISLVTIALAISLISILNIFGTIGTGLLTDRLNRSKLLALLYFIRGISFVILIYFQTPAFLLIFAIIYGATEMATISPTGSLCVHYFQANSIGKIFGFIVLSHHLGASVGSYLAGVSYDLFGSYERIFIIAAFLLLVNVLVILRIREDRTAALSS